MTRRARLAGAALATALCPAIAAAGCGSSAVQILDPAGKRPLVNALDVDERDDTLLVTTNRGFFRVDPESGKAREIRGLVRVGRRTSPVGRFLEVLADGPGRMYGSGHPDQPETLPQFLGLMRSRDGGQTWTVIARLGRADLHEMVAAHGSLYAADAVLGALLVSSDGGRTFAERFTPRGQVVDLAVSPADPDRVFVSMETHMFRSADLGSTWDLAGEARGAQLAWPVERSLFRADADGTVLVSSDGGKTWTRRGRLAREPVKLHEHTARMLDAVLADGTIHRTTDGGRTWKAIFEP
jgi:photosystem II stability/assembly factor-like uncharacterized protein